jgi:hypothetical protein
MATTLGIELRRGKVRAECDVDLRGVLAVSDTVPVAFQNIRLSFDLGSDADDKQLAELMAMTEHCCVIYQTLRRPAAFEFRMTASATADA